MATREIRVLIVDDSPLMREVVDVLQEAGDIQVVGTARDGLQALELVTTLSPDVVTLDVEMPNMDGLAALDAILERKPVPVLMVSALTQRGATVTLDALERGAMDYIGKPESVSRIGDAFRDDLIRRIRAIAGIDVHRMLRIRQERAEKARAREAAAREARPAAPLVAPSEVADKCIALGISTGGPPALTALFETLHASIPPMVIVQHMPPHFTGPLAWRLNSISPLTIKEAEAGDVLAPNYVYIAPGGRHVEVVRRGKQAATIRLLDGEPVSGHRPSADVAMTSIAQAFGARTLGVIMTGMGRDGADGCRAIRAAGGYVLGQDEGSSAVYGMNKVAMIEGNVDRQFSLDDAASAITSELVRLGASRRQHALA